MILELLKDTSKTYKTLVLCSNNNEVDEAKEHLDIAGIDTLFVYDSLEKKDIVELETQWLIASPGNNSGKQYNLYFYFSLINHNLFTVLICTDRTYNCLLNISNSIQLIHYSLPDTWTEFSNRFGCLIDNYVSPLLTSKPVSCSFNCLYANILSTV